VNLVFVELPAFERHRSHCLDDDGFRWLQHQVMSSPDSGDVIEGTGGLRKLRFADMRRGLKARLRAELAARQIGE